MQKIKKLFINLVAVMVAIVACFSLVGCEDIKKVELNIEVYDYADNGSMQNYTMTVDLYRHLAPETVDAIKGYVEAGYYDNTVFYKMKDYSGQIMVGDLVVENARFAQNDIKPQLPGEFEAGGTKGSNLLNKKGSIGLWRSWYESDESYTTTSDAMNSGSATWFIPTDSLSSYDNYFCVFAQFDAKETKNADTLAALTKAFEDSAKYDEFEIYYTGTYDAEKPLENYGLTFHVEEKANFNEENIDGLFKAEGAQLKSFNHHTIQVPMTANGKLGAKIVSAKIV